MFVYIIYDFRNVLDEVAAFLFLCTGTDHQCSGP